MRNLLSIPRAPLLELLFLGSLLLGSLIGTRQTPAQTVLPKPSLTLSTSPPGTPVFDLDKDRQPLVSLDGPWRRQLGDNPGWADPGFDDSSWPIVRPDQPWAEQKFSGIAWYRAKVQVPANVGPLALYFFWIDNSYQVFADGHLLLSAGGLPPHPHVYIIEPGVLRLPHNDNGNQPYTFTLAIRVWLSPGFAVSEHGGIWPGSLIGSPRLMQGAFEAQTTRWAWGAVSRIILTFLEGLAACTALALLSFRRKEREYLWFALFLLASVALRCYRTYFQFNTLGYGEFNAISGVILILGSVAEIAFYYRLLGGRRNGLLWVVLGCDAALLATTVPMYMGFFNDAVLSALAVAFIVPTITWILALLVRRAIQGFPDARLLIAPLFFAKIAVFVAFAIWLLQSLNLYHGSTAWFERTLTWPFDVSLRDIGDVLFLVGMLAVLIHRFTRTRLHEETYEREREAARTVQQLLIPEADPHIPGFEIASIYMPASEVSGDFFQIIPLHDGSVLIAIGDVSGKGLPAALMVSLLVGTLRTYAEALTSPAQILTGLNRRLYNRSNGGFTTCLIMHADPSGTLTIANAGHLSPYCEGKEIPVESGLPLGILPDAVYEEIARHLDVGESITLLTDGVTEARNHTGQLFGFERTQSISRQSPAEIARTARDFGQDDDITVLKLSRMNA
jgi:sigma-B regulation protein RsbU (phosphoserine phosphatase)